MGRTKRVAAVFVMTGGLVLASAGVAAAEGTEEPAPAPAPEENCVVTLVGGTLADPVGGLTGALADPGGTITAVVTCVGSTLGLGG
jgi:hypothetical protein